MMVVVVVVVVEGGVKRGSVNVNNVYRWLDDNTSEFKTIEPLRDKSQTLRRGIAKWCGWTRLSGRIISFAIIILVWSVLSLEGVGLAGVQIGFVWTSE